MPTANLIRTILFISFAIMVGCGYKTDPRAKETLSIPTATEAKVTLGEFGILISNGSSEYPVLVERAESEIGDLQTPRYRKIVTVPPQGEFNDDTAEYGKRYVYRLSNYMEKYNTYSSTISKTISYRGRVAIDDVKWTIEKDNVCIDIISSNNVSRVSLMLNGVETPRMESGKCYKLPPVSKVLMVLVPYDESTPGMAYSTVLAIDETVTLLPPQNIKVLRRGGQLSISWDRSPMATQYKLSVFDGKLTHLYTTDATIYSLSVKGCVKVKISTLSKNKESSFAEVESCE